MSKIAGKDTKPEIAVRKCLFKLGFRYRTNVKDLSGKPDIVLKKYNTIILVNGCFWHGHICKAAKLPQTKTEFWSEKINANRLRDEKNKKLLEASGWKIITIWVCEIKQKEAFKARMLIVVNELRRNGKSR